VDVVDLNELTVERAEAVEGGLKYFQGPFRRVGFNPAGRLLKYGRCDNCHRPLRDYEDGLTECGRCDHLHTQEDTDEVERHLVGEND
jgi:hypothetical protein